jgi:predicted DNA binding protein
VVTLSQIVEEPYHVAIEVENQQCRGLRVLEESGVKEFSLIDIRGEPDGPTRHLLTVPTESFKDLPTQLFSETQVGISKETRSAWFNSEGCVVCKTILANSSFLVSARHLGENTIVYSFVVPSFGGYRKIISTLEAQGMSLKLREMTKFNPRSRTLTEKQERALWLALKMGFFDYPRKITMKELAKRVGVGLSTLSEILRRGTRRLLEEQFEYDKQ